MKYIKLFEEIQSKIAIQKDNHESLVFNGRFNLTITQLDKEPNMFQKFIKRF